MENERPTGVFIFGILDILIGGYIFFMSSDPLKEGISTLFFSASRGNTTGWEGIGLICGFFLGIIGIIASLPSLVAIYIGIITLQLREKGRKLNIFFVFPWLCIAGFGEAYFRLPLLGLPVGRYVLLKLAFIIYGIILFFYFIDPKVKEQFK